MAKQYTINTKYLAQTILNPRDFPQSGTVSNIIKAKQYGINPNLVLSQVAAEGKFIIKSRGLQALKTVVIGDLTSGDYATGEDLRKQQQEGTSRFGLPIYDVIQFSGDSNDNVLRYSTKEWDSKKGAFIEKNIEVQPTALTTCLFEVDQHKNIITTNIQGRNGPVYEYIGMGPYVINIRGVIVSPYTDVYPTDAVNNLISMLKAPVSLKITSNVLNSIFNILKVVVTDFHHYQDEGMRNVVHFDMVCMDENPFEIKKQQL